MCVCVCVCVCVCGRARARVCVRVTGLKRRVAQNAAVKGYRHVVEYLLGECSLRAKKSLEKPIGFVLDFCTVSAGADQ
eukprot:COSAG03_NODE_7165_length_955_cov_43.726636_3_plen_78_part_00